MALTLLNTYPLLISQDFIFQAKQTALLQSAQNTAAILSELPDLQASAVAASVFSLNLEATRIIVTNADSWVVYDNDSVDSAVGRFLLQNELLRALAGSEVFYIRYTGAAFESRAAVPITNEGRVLGAVCVYEQDTEQAGILRRVQQNLLSFTLVTAGLAVVLSFILSAALSRRMHRLLLAIRDLGAGRYGRRIHLSGRDELAELAREFNRLAERIERTEVVRRQFVSDASHELRTPLSSMRLLTDSILQTPGIELRTVREFVSDIAAELDRLSHMTGRLIQLSRAEDREPLGLAKDSPAESSDFSEVLQRVRKSLRPLAVRDGITLHVDSDPACVVRASAEDLYQVAYNLIDNAVKYNRPGGEVRATLFVRDGTAILTVADTGVGIPEEDLPHIFDRFYRVDKARVRTSAVERKQTAGLTRVFSRRADADAGTSHSRHQDVGGSGLGLSIVYHTVHRLGGSVQVESSLGAGTRFVVRLEGVL